MHASELYAISQGAVCQGGQACYWCGAPCSQKYIHGEPPLGIGQKFPEPVLFRQSAYYCAGCWLWRRPRLTAFYLDQEFKDGQAPRRCSWWFTERQCYAIRFEDGKHLYPILLKPPLRFVLSLVHSGQANHLQLALANDNEQVLANTPLHFTVNGAPFTYTIFGLKQALRTGDGNGHEPGVRELMSLFGSYRLPEEEGDGKKRGRGRPPLGEEVTSRAAREMTSLVRGLSGTALVNFDAAASHSP